MSQETNLNVSPYFDDFDFGNEYYKVLFKPGYPVQARELTTLQSILQNQIEQFGNHIFKEGSVVVPGNIVYKNDLNSVILDDYYQGLPSGIYLESLLGTKIKGQRSGVTATIESYLKTGNGVSKNTLFVKYLTSGNQDNSQKTFIDGDNLLLDQDILVLDPNTIDEEDPSEILIRTGEGFATTISQNSTSIGSAVYLEEGIYFLRGYFVSVPTSILYLDPYSNVPSAKVGLRVYEKIKTSYDDDSLYDNSQGFSNYAAPGADRFSIFATLEQIPLDSIDTNNFVQLLEIDAGRIVNISNKPEYNILAQEFARRTFDESGDYYVNPPIVKAQETLNNFLGNNGVFNSNQLTYNNNVPNENLATYNISPLKAYVRGFEIETVSPTFLDFPKPRNTKTLEDQSINYYTGSTITLNRVYGSPIVSIATTYYVSLRDSRIGVSSHISSGNEIGLARVYDFALESGSYTTSNPQENQWDITLYDIQSYTTIQLNEPITLNTPTHIKGKQSGAVGFLRYDVSAGTAITVYSSSGKFSLGEKLIFDGVENTRVTKSIKEYGISDVKSIYGVVGAAYTFNADTIQSPSTLIGQVKITAESGGISTVTSSNVIFTGIVTTGNLVAFSNPGISTISYAKITSVSDRTLGISSVTSVVGVCNGDLPTVEINPSDFKIITTTLQSSEDNSLYTVLPKQYVSNVDLTNSSLTIRKQFDVTITSNSTGVINAGTNETFLPFDEERYVLIMSSGQTETLTEDKFSFGSGSSSLTISGISGNGSAKLIATLRKNNVKSKIKNRNRIKSIVIDKSIYSASGVGATTLNDGLTYGNYPYGTRVQDEEICLLEPDVVGVYGVFESSGITDPNIPSLVLTSINGPTNKTGDLLIGESFIGERSQSLGIYVEKINDFQIGFNNLNTNSFIEGEKVTFGESGITAFVSVINSGDKDISSSFTFDSNQKETIYDYSKLIRNSNSKEPIRKLKIVYESASFSASDTGDITTVNSYEQFNYSNITSIYDTLRNSDILDIRPRVSPTSPSLNSRSPFEFLARNFTSSGNSASNILASDESILLSYSFYLPRIDKILIDKTGGFQLKIGTPAETPQPPIINEDVLEIATAYLQPYLINVNEINIELKEHKRYRMSDIGKLEDRIENLEYYTSLSLLEVNASNFSVLDDNQRNRFKCGFFVDNFTSNDNQDRLTVYKNSIDPNNLELRPTHFTTSVDLLLGTNSSIGLGAEANPLADARTDTSLIGSGVKRTGQLVTLDYIESIIIDQPYASRAVNVNPYTTDFYTGTIFLQPSSDVWVDQVRSTGNTIFIDREETELEKLLQYDPQTGFAGATWDSATNNWVIPEKRTSFGDVVLNTRLIPYMRSRNIEFIAKRLKPSTRVYSFFGGIDINKYIIPKLLEINMISGVFQVGETVIGSFDDPNGLLPKITFRVAQQNHKYGTYNSPSDVYTINPYNSTTNISESYSSTSSILNIDTYSLSNQPQGQFSGYISIGMKLRGQTSQAEATIVDVKLITDNTGSIIGSFFIPNPNTDVNPKFECGSKTFRLTSSNTNSLIFGTYTTSAEEKYVSEGKVDTVQENVIISRPIRIEAPQDEPMIPGPGTPQNPAPASEPTAPTPQTPESTTSTIQTSESTPIPTIVYYNYGTPNLFEGGQKRFKDLAREADVPRDLIKKIDGDMTKKQEEKIVTLINNSSYAQQNNIQVSTGSAKNSTKTEIGTGQKVGVEPNKVGKGETAARIYEPKKADNKNNNVKGDKFMDSIVSTSKFSEGSRQGQVSGGNYSVPSAPAPAPNPAKDNKNTGNNNKNNDNKKDNNNRNNNKNKK